MKRTLRILQNLILDSRIDKNKTEARRRILFLLANILVTNILVIASADSPCRKLTNMAPLIQRLLFLGIILLLTNHYVKSSPARIPVKDVKDKETSDKSHTGNELKNSVDQSREDKAGKS